MVTALREPRETLHSTSRGCQNGPVHGVPQPQEPGTEKHQPQIDQGAGSTAALSRDHTIVVSPSGLITITGGKWTTYRLMAAEATDAVAAKLGVKSKFVVREEDAERARLGLEQQARGGDTSGPRRPLSGNRRCRRGIRR